MGQGQPGGSEQARFAHEVDARCDLKREPSVGVSESRIKNENGSSTAQPRRPTADQSTVTVTRASSLSNHYYAETMITVKFKLRLRVARGGNGEREKERRREKERATRREGGREREQDLKERDWRERERERQREPPSRRGRECV